MSRFDTIGVPEGKEQEQQLLEQAAWQPDVPVQDEKVRWVWADLILADSVNLLVAPGNTGKTRLAFELMAALRDGAEELYGRKLDPGFDSVACFYGMTTEMNEATAQNLARMTGLGADNASGEFVPRCWWWRDVDLLFDAAREYRARHPRGLLIMDSVISLFNPDCSDSNETTRILNQLKDLGGTLLVLHHENKDKDQKGANKVFGSTSWVHQSHRLLRLRRADNGLVIEASRRGPEIVAVLGVDWSAPATETDEASEARPRNHKLMACKDWIMANKEVCTEATTVKAAWGIACSHGLDVGYLTFVRAYQDCDLSS